MTDHAWAVLEPLDANDDGSSSSSSRSSRTLGWVWWGLMVGISCANLVGLLWVRCRRCAQPAPRAGLLAYLRPDYTEPTPLRRSGAVVFTLVCAYRSVLPRVWRLACAVHCRLALPTVRHHTTTTLSSVAAVADRCGAHLLVRLTSKLDSFRALLRDGG
jgi:hypothetical protein